MDLQGPSSPNAGRASFPGGATTISSLPRHDHDPVSLAPQNEFEREATVLDSAGESVQMALEMLEKRLERVLHSNDRPSGRSDAEKSIDPQTSLGRVLRAASDRNYASTARIYSMLERLAI